VGILDNYFRMRSYSYGVHPDLLLNGQTENPDAGRRSPSGSATGRHYPDEN
jgi:hypothetical protein